MPSPPTVIALSASPTPDPRVAALARSVATMVAELWPPAVVIEVESAGDGDAAAASPAVASLLAGATIVVAACQGPPGGLLPGAGPRTLPGTLAVPVTIGTAAAAGLRARLVALGAVCPTAALTLDDDELDLPDPAIGPWLERDARVLWATLRRSLRA